MSTWSLPVPVRALLFASLGALATSALLTTWHAAAMADEPAIWWATRATGFVAYGALALSMFFGLMVSSKGAEGLLSKKAVMDLHQQWTLSGVVATGTHIFTAVFHAEAGVTPWAAVIPFASRTLTGPVALGTVAFIGLLVVVVSSSLRKHVPYAAWRAIHGLSFGVMLLALAHGITAGSDTALPAIQWMYVLTSAVLVGAVTTRVLLTFVDRSQHRSRRAA
jgi:methionine sulfoxide reductase heme-binding subunit